MASGDCVKEGLFSFGVEDLVTYPEAPSMLLFASPGLHHELICCSQQRLSTFTRLGLEIRLSVPRKRRRTALGAPCSFGMHRVGDLELKEAGGGGE